MIAAGLSNPQLVRLVRRRRVGLPPASGVVIVSHIFTHLVAAIGPSGRALAAWLPPRPGGLFGMTALLHVEGG